MSGWVWVAPSILWLLVRALACLVVLGESYGLGVDSCWRELLGVLSEGVAVGGSCLFHKPAVDIHHLWLGG